MDSISTRIAKAGGSARALLARRGFVARLDMMGGWFTETGDGRGPPILYATVDDALADIHRRPSWGWSACDVYRATVVPNAMNGLPDYVIQECVANGADRLSSVPRRQPMYTIKTEYVTRSAVVWLRDTFEFENCEECHRGERAHACVDIGLGPFAVCRPTRRTRELSPMQRLAFQESS